LLLPRNDSGLRTLQARSGGEALVIEALRWLRSLWPFGGRMMIPERRSGTRYLTVKNAVRAAIVLVVAFFLLSLWSEFRPAHSGGLERPLATSADAPAAAREGSPNDYPRAALDVPAPTPAPPPPPKRALAPAPRLGDGQRIAITGGKDGVEVHVDTTPAPAKKPAPETGTQR
jgi:hypothetical protein